MPKQKVSRRSSCAPRRPTRHLRRRSRQAARDSHPAARRRRELAQGTAGEVAILFVDRLHPGSVDGEQLSAVEAEPPAQQQRTDETQRGTPRDVASKVGDGLEVGLEAAQPNDLDVAMGFALQSAARPHPVQIAVDIELQQVARRITRMPRRLGCNSREPCRREVQPVDEGLNEPNRIVAIDVSSITPRATHRSDEHMARGRRGRLKLRAPTPLRVAVSIP